jgi:hypothetical protein
MEHNEFSESQNKIGIAPLPDERDKLAVFSYVNQGSPRGHEARLWLAAEAELIANGKLTRVPGFLNHT